MKHLKVFLTVDYSIFLLLWFQAKTYTTPLTIFTLTILSLHVVLFGLYILKYIATKRDLFSYDFIIKLFLAANAVLGLGIAITVFISLRVDSKIVTDISSCYYLHIVIIFLAVFKGVKDRVLNNFDLQVCLLFWLVQYSLMFLFNSYLTEVDVLLIVLVGSFGSYLFILNFIGKHGYKINPDGIHYMKNSVIQEPVGLN